MPEVCALVTTNVRNKKVGEVENKVKYISSSLTIDVLNTKIGEVENKITDISGLVKKMDYTAKISHIEAKYFTTSDYNWNESKRISW